MPNDAHTMLTRSRDLRKNMTREEKHLYYDGLKKLPWKFLWQQVFENYIVDFYCAELKVVVEVDGTQHFLEKGKAYDAVRDDALRDMGLLVLRYSNADVNRQFDNVVADIYKHCENRQEKR